VISLIDRYIAKSFIFYFFAGLSIFVTLFVAIDFLTSTARFSVDLGVFAEYYAFYSFEMLFQLIPVACLLATLFTIGTLHKNSELVAMFSMGLSLVRVALPILVIVSGLSLVSFIASNELMTKAVDKRNFIYYTIMKKKPWQYSNSKQENIWYRSGQNIFNINLLNAKEAKAFEVTLYTFSSDWMLQQILIAKEALLNEGQWTLKNGSVTVFFDEESAPITDTFTSKNLEVGENVIDIKTSSKASAQMGVRELRRYIERNKEAGLNTVPFEVDYYSKFSYVFTTMVMVLLGLSFATSGSNRSGGVLLNLQKCVLLTLIYWGIYNSGLTLGRHGTIPPVIAAWAPNLLMIMLASLIIWRQKR
jgi:lipopolysaccharide export system permease protein